MPRIIERTVYKFNELSDKAKAHARDTARDWDTSHDWWEYVYEQASEAADMLGISIATKPVKLNSGKTRQDPCIYFSGFSSQGDGASFEGRYRPKVDAVDTIANEFCADSELQTIAQQLALLQVSSRIKHGRRLEATIKLGGSGYCHSHMMDVDVTFVDEEDGISPDLEDEKELTHLMRAFADWIYSQLEAENEYLTSDEHIDEILSDSGHEFDESGALI